jgi:hypothetical protein
VALQELHEMLSHHTGGAEYSNFNAWLRHNYCVS